MARGNKKGFEISTNFIVYMAIALAVLALVLALFNIHTKDQRTLVQVILDAFRTRGA